MKFMNMFQSFAKSIYTQNSFVRLMSYPFFLESYKKGNFNCLIQSIFKKKNLEHDSIFHLEKSINWLLKSIDQKESGSRAYYNLNRGWSSAYPETTGYIVKTLFDLYDIYEEKKFYTSAETMSNWLISIQLKNGSFPGGVLKNSELTPNVFNTGQILIGLIRAYTETNEQKYLESMERAARWLSNSINADGSWSNYIYENGPRSYSSRVSWPMLKANEFIDDDKIKDNALKNILWVLDNQHSNGWFDNSNFFTNEFTLTHTLAYTIRGLLESFIILKDKEILDHIDLTIEKLFKLYEIRKYELYPAYFDNKWNQKSSFSCLTGCAQLSIIFMKYYEITKDIRYFNTSLKINSNMKRVQCLSKNSSIDGAIGGSFPLNGNYMPLSFPNWATKFFIDSLLLEIKIKKDLE